MQVGLFDRPFVALNLLNSELNPICHLLALLEAHHILHDSRIRVKLMSKSWDPCSLNEVPDFS